MMIICNLMRKLLFQKCIFFLIFLNFLFKVSADVYSCFVALFEKRMVHFQFVGAFQPKNSPGCRYTLLSFDKVTTLFEHEFQMAK